MQSIPTSTEVPTQIASAQNEAQTQQRYDRQIRLWGIQGQRRLTKSSICLLGCGGAGVEALKNLVLPGVGQIVIVDNQTVRRQDFGMNFFLEKSSLGKNRASETVKFLLEMNPYVKGYGVEETPESCINEEFLNKHTLIISNQLSEKSNVLLSEICEKINKPLIILNTYGFYVYIRNQMVCHQIHQVKENRRYDLRVRQPFEELISHCNSYNMENLIANQYQGTNGITLVHIPYSILLTKAMMLSPNKKKEQVKQILSKWRNAIDNDEAENFVEADKNLVFSINQKKQNVFDDLKIITEHSRCLNADENSINFWKFVKTLRLYIEKYNSYPQSHDLPDMHATTDFYINLKTVYKKQNARTKLLFKDIFAEQFPSSTYEDIEIDTFVENIMSLSIVQMRPYYQEIKDPQFSPGERWTQIYNALRAADHFKQKNNKVPIVKNFDEIKKQVTEILASVSNKDAEMSSDQVIQQVCRVEQSQMISISSIAGSIAAQQAIKLITHLFTPMNSGYLFDGTVTEGWMTEL